MLLLVLNRFCYFMFLFIFISRPFHTLYIYPDPLFIQELIISPLFVCFAKILLLLTSSFIVLDPEKTLHRILIFKIPLKLMLIILFLFVILSLKPY